VRGPGPGHDWSSSISRSFEATGVASACVGVVVVVVGGGGTVRRETRTGATKKKNPARVCLTRVICRARDDDGDAMRDDAGACGCASG